jgi:hypothetical protein
VLELISKNKTEDCDIYTMGCDCDEEAIKALARLEKWESNEQQTATNKGAK